MGVAPSGSAEMHILLLVEVAVDAVIIGNGAHIAYSKLGAFLQNVTQ